MGLPKMNGDWRKLGIILCKTHFQNRFLEPVTAQNKKFFINPLMFSVTFLYPLKTSQKCRFPDIFKENKNVTLDIKDMG